jgi:hypothetical protein
MQDVIPSAPLPRSPSLAHDHVPLPPEIMRFVDVLPRIELRRQARLRAKRLREAN